MARKPQLFFSHSAEEGSSDRAVLMGLADALKDDYDILLDRTALVAGGSWRPIINGWVTGCDAAVILITPESIDSDFCRYEWSALSFRHREDDLLIIPVYHRARPDDIKGRADQISDITGYFDFDNIESLSHKLKERLSAESSSP
jgi:hypothetical protein